jgi:hypothetical protein
MVKEASINGSPLASLNGTTPVYPANFFPQHQYSTDWYKKRTTLYPVHFGAILNNNSMHF